MNAVNFELLADATGYRDRGISCIPVSSKNGEKRPQVKWKEFVDRLPTDDELRTWFGRGRVNGVGVIAANGLAVRDFDMRDGYDAFRRAHPALARALPTVKTGRGFHVWCRSDLPKIVKLVDGEWRGAGISLAPHSRHFSGVTYEWLNPLPEGELPQVESRVFLETNTHNDTENAECHFSAVSASSALSAFSAISVSSVDEVIRATLPKRAGERNTCLLRLARGVKFNLGMADASFAILKPIAKQWHALALPIITTKDFDTTWADFLHAFERARHPLGIDVVDQVSLNIDPDDLPAVASNYDSLAAHQLLGLCHGLSKLNPAGRFFLSCHDAAARLGITPMATWRLLRSFEGDGVIEPLERGNEFRATRYRWAAVDPHESP